MRENTTNYYIVIVEDDRTQWVGLMDFINRSFEGITVYPANESEFDVMQNQFYKKDFNLNEVKSFMKETLKFDKNDKIIFIVDIDLRYNSAEPHNRRGLKFINYLHELEKTETKNNSKLSGFTEDSWDYIIVTIDPNYLGDFDFKKYKKKTNFIKKEDFPIFFYKLIKQIIIRLWELH